MRIRKCVLWILTLSIAALIFFFSTQSVGQSSQLSAGLTDGVLSILQKPDVTLEQHLAIDGMLRDAAHIAMFTALGFSAALLMRCYTKQLIGWALIAGICSAYAVFDECIQRWFARGRAFEWEDILKDCIGVMFGIGMVALGCFWVIQVRRKKGN